jgi:hypothetical protein
MGSTRLASLASYPKNVRTTKAEGEEGARMNRRGVLVSFSTCVLAALSIVAAGCAVSAEPPAQQWEKVTSGRISGDQNSKQYLGTFYLVAQARLAWDLSGPSDARAEFELMVTRAPDAYTTEGSGSSARSWKDGFAPLDDDALSVSVPEPGEYAVTLSQRLRPKAGSGYTGTFTLYTRLLD